MLLVCRESFERLSAGTERKREQGEEVGGEIGKILNKGQRHAMQENECYHRPKRRSKEPSREGGWSWSVRFLNPLLNPKSPDGMPFGRCYTCMPSHPNV